MERLGPRRAARNHQALRTRSQNPALRLRGTRAVRALTLILVVLLSGCREQAPPADRPASAARATSAQHTEPSRCVDEWQTVAEGARYRTVGCVEDREFELHVVELDPKQWTIDVSHGPRRPMRDAIASSRARFAINANFFDVNDRALGVVVASGKVVQGAHPVSWQSIFAVEKDGAHIVTRDRWPSLAPKAFAAVQAGPRLVIDGKKNQVAKAEPSLRSGVCITSKGMVRFFATPHDSYLDVHEMVDFASRSDEDGGMGCRDAMLFDGGPSAQIFLETDGKKIDVNGDVVPTFMVASPR
jgi:uncharacterized protein YigE (DUF2233 family)